MVINFRRFKSSREQFKLIFFVTYLSTTFMTFYQLSQLISKDSDALNTESVEKLRVCIVGNAENRQRATDMHFMWNGEFDSYWYVWGENYTKPLVTVNNIHFIYKTQNLAWTQGIELLVDHIFSKRIMCDYIFTHDDDLKFSLRKSMIPSNKTNAAALLDTLNRYRPAVAGFPWKFGDCNIKAMKELSAYYQNEPVSPLTGFDNGMVIYHRSIVRFFIPYSPKGEGGFRGYWTLCAHFLQMFSYLIFEEYAIRLNMFQYRHLININKINPTNRSHSKTIIRNGLAYVGNSRHPYEYPQNSAYIAFLSSGLKQPARNWGRRLSVLDNLRKMNSSNLPYRNTFDGLWLLKRLNQVYDIRHEALSSSRLLNEQFTLEQKIQVLRETEFRLRLILLTTIRQSSFERLWKSVNTALKINRKIILDIHVDLDEKDERRKDYLKYLHSLTSSHGEVRVITYSSHRGLKSIMAEAWYPYDNDEFAMFLEDDIEVSPFFLRYTEKLIQAYFYDWEYDQRLFGISLYNQRYNEVVERYVNVPNNNNLYIYQIPQSWGAVYHASMWQRFTKYLKQNFDPFIPNSYTNRWPCNKSWKKYLLRFMLMEQAFLIYPNFPDNLSISTNHIEYGLNNKISKGKDDQNLRQKYTLKLLDDSRIYDELKTPPLTDLHIYNLYHRRLDSIEELKISNNSLRAFDSCTMIMAVYDRYNTTIDRLKYYQNFTYISAIVVIWNNPDVQPVNQSDLSHFRIPIYILKMKVNSLNNRFYPHKEIKTDCIINMDDDWDMPYEHMSFAIDTWRGHFFQNLVSYSHLGRNHVWGKLNETYQYIYTPRRPKTNTSEFYSIALPSGLVYHRRYLHMYSFSLPRITREIVDSLQNCDDILFNFMVANHTKQGPVFIKTSAKAYSLGGLWKRGTHMDSRSYCLNKFTEIFGRMPLKYTTRMFKLDRNNTVPGKNRHFYQSSMPVQ